MQIYTASGMRRLITKCGTEAKLFAPIIHQDLLRDEKIQANAERREDDCESRKMEAAYFERDSGAAP
ncbi:MAG: hypothetical protein ABIU85_09590 [Methylotenera sp.]